MSAPPPAIERVAILPLRNSVLFPRSVVPINVGRPRSVRLIEDLESSGGVVGVVAQRDAAVIEPGFEDLYAIGTLARVVKVIRVSATSYSVVLNGLSRCELRAPLGLEPFMRAEVARVEDWHDQTSGGTAAELARAADTLRRQTRQALELMPELPRETAAILDNVDSPGALADLIASNFPEELANVAVRQRVLDSLEVAQRLRLVSKMLDKQLESLRIKREISTLVETEMTKTQRAYVLRQQMRTIREQLGESPDEDDEVDALRERLALLDLPDEARTAARKQLGRLATMQSQSAEYQVARTYVEWILDLPWRSSTPDRLDVAEVQRCLDQDHHGLETVKKRIVEFAAVRQLRRDNRGPILLLLGPPGVGKTSLGRSIARAMGRRYGRVALGGVRDEAEIRGHRRTYVGALPGRIIQALKKVGTNNPVLVLDEVDKMGADQRGDPAAALLEVLDPSQNDTFVDHYLEVPFDLSKVMFICTANYAAQIPDPLYDRLEVIDVSGYTTLEKRGIALSHLVPKQVEGHGLSSSRVEFSPEGIDELIEAHTREAGVRNLERVIASVCRELAVRLAAGKDIDGTRVDRELVEEILGAPRYVPELTEQGLPPGVGIGLGNGTAGGELLLVEASRMPGKAGVRVTGSLGPVLAEAAHMAVSFVRSRAERLELSPDFMKDLDLHLHIPRARAARDFAGMGVAIFASVTSLLIGVPLRSDVGVVGELTLRGAVLPVRGVEPMLLAAVRAGIRTIVLPARNEPDVAEVPSAVRDELNIIYVRHVDEVLPHLFAAPATGRSPADQAPSSALHA